MMFFVKIVNQRKGILTNFGSKIVISLVTMQTKTFLCSWSGGKDSCYAFHKAVNSGFKPTVLLNVLNEHGDRSRSHGIPKGILEAQGEALGLPIHFFESTWEDYERLYIENLKSLQQSYGFGHSVFGDIDIESHRAWEEKVSKAAGVSAILPLWQESRTPLVVEMIQNDIEAIITSCNQVLGPDFLGRKIDAQLLKELEEIGVDPCGENGEYHTLVINAPLFRKPLDIKVTGKEKSTNYNFATLELV